MVEKKIGMLIEEHERWRTNGINLIASENTISEPVRKALTSDLAGRYHNEWYGGSKVAVEIIEATESLAQRLFKADHAIVTPLSGNICDLTVLLNFTSPGEKVAMVPISVGGYPLGVKKFHRELVPLPVDEKTYDIDVPKAKETIFENDVKLTILGSSFLLFPHPVREMREVMEKKEDAAPLVYDGSHVLGLIACSQFQDPLREGAEILIGSTHKSFYGPQGGMILTNSLELAEACKAFLDLDLEEGIGLVDNPHMSRIAALGVAMEEMLADPDYGKRVVKNAKALAKALDELSVPIRFKDRGFTESHQVLLDLGQEEAKSLCHRLEAVGIFIDIGGRLGAAEVTHLGMGPTEMSEIASMISDVYNKKAGEGLKEEILKLATSRK